MLKCRDIPDRATAAIEGNLAARDWLAVKFHLLLCSMCRAYLDQLRKTQRLLGRKPLDPPDRAREDQLVALITGRKGDDPT